jgi:alkanesulfonate monooxygenase SsuD/methylene tetrahydromethanopterin reductase-like flavin-dependent oxidoreductase (luciferase family)
MCPDPLQFLTYMAGRTQKVKLGSMVVVLPWHDPMRVAEQVSMLDHLSNGRLILGLGRGAGRVEFDGFRQDMGDSRPRFVESADCVLQGPARLLRVSGGMSSNRNRHPPGPLKTFRGRTYAAAVSPESLEIMAKLGVGILVVPQSREAVRSGDQAIQRVVRTSTKNPLPIPRLTFVDPDRDRAYELAKRYIGGCGNGGSALPVRQRHLKGKKGYEYYGKFADNIQSTVRTRRSSFSANIQTWARPRCASNA